MMLQPSDQKATHRYFDRQFNCESVKVLPGEYFISADPLLIVTVLGSCIAACVRDKVNGIGGMNHFMLPDAAGDDDEASYSMRYGSFAMEVLINDLLKAGAVRRHLEAKVFGGGNVMATSQQQTVGIRNARFVNNFLATEGIPITASDLNQNWGRKVLFFPVTGKVLVKRVLMTHQDAVLKHEIDYAKNLKQVPKSGDVDLF